MYYMDIMLGGNTNATVLQHIIITILESTIGGKYNFHYYCYSLISTLGRKKSFSLTYFLHMLIIKVYSVLYHKGMNIN